MTGRMCGAEPGAGVRGKGRERRAGRGAGGKEEETGRSRGEGSKMTPPPEEERGAQCPRRCRAETGEEGEFPSRRGVGGRGRGWGGKQRELEVKGKES